MEAVEFAPGDTLEISPEDDMGEFRAHLFAARACAEGAVEHLWLAILALLPGRRW